MNIVQDHLVEHLICGKANALSDTPHYLILSLSVIVSVFALHVVGYMGKDNQINGYLFAE
jgi:hypothetical protein